MKKLKVISIIVLMFVFSISSNAQSLGKLYPPVGLTFGMTSSAIKNALLNKGAKVYSERDGMILFTNVKIGTLTPDIFACSIVNNKLYEVKVAFFPKPEVNYQKMFDDLREIIESKYGRGESFRNFKGVYEDGDGYELTAIKTGNASISSYWVNFENESSIGLNVVAYESLISVELTYQDGILIDEKIAEQDKKNAADF